MPPFAAGAVLGVGEGPSETGRLGLGTEGGEGVRDTGRLGVGSGPSVGGAGLGVDTVGADGVKAMGRFGVGRGVSAGRVGVGTGPTARTEMAVPSTTSPAPARPIRATRAFEALWDPPISGAEESRCCTSCPPFAAMLGDRI